MANPLQPACIKVLEQEYGAFVVVATSTTKSGIMDILACVRTAHWRDGLFYGFEIKWKNDRPSELQKEKINQLEAAGGKGYFIRSVEQLRNVLDNDLPSERYQLKKLTL